jgi:hypothetical protein
LKQSAQEFFRDICHNSEKSPRFAYIPVLQFIAPSAFFEAVIALPPSDWRVVSRALKERYSGSALTKDLAEELPWAESILNFFDGQIAVAHGIRRVKLERFVSSADLRSTVTKARSVLRSATTSAAPSSSTQSPGSSASITGSPDE